eukprot:TRINITY_DN959_c0_g1_i4.p1 TRINITY_DN959_c0_g1~~TRINITY_DN959_c0_g1_i4.p1  ORF type:complete len:1341 (+),score=371.01 TRINITY_DN959_c0_g1_i4:65-4087(+)
MRERLSSPNPRPRLQKLSPPPPPNGAPAASRATRCDAPRAAVAFALALFLAFWLGDMVRVKTRPGRREKRKRKAGSWLGGSQWDMYDNYDTGVEEIAQCIAADPKPFPARVNLALLVPFVPPEAAQLEALLHSMGENYEPCATDAARDYDSALVFYMARPYHLDSKRARYSLEAVVDALPEEARGCFDRVVFIDAMLTKEQDEYHVAGRGNGMQGPNIMFYNLFTHWELENYTHAAIVEPDAVFVKRGWLDAIRATAVPGVWQDGSLVGAAAFNGPLKGAAAKEELEMKRRGREFLPEAQLPDAATYAAQRFEAYAELRSKVGAKGDWDLPMKNTNPQRSADWVLPLLYQNPLSGPYSVNGNALYFIAEPCFKVFVQRLSKYEYHPGYDHNLFAYRANPYHGELTRAVYGKFRTSGVFLDVAHKPWKRVHVHREYPEVYIVTQAYKKRTPDYAAEGSVHQDFWKRYERWDQSAADVSRCSASAPPAKVRLAVVVPFRDGDLDGVRSLLAGMRQHVPLRSPLRSKGPRDFATALVFYASQYFSMLDGAKKSLEDAVANLPSDARRAFDEVLFVGAGLTDEEDDNDAQRPTAMFQNMFVKWRLKKFTHAALLGLDTAFIRPGWLDALRSSLVPGVWMSGGLAKAGGLTAPLSLEEKALEAEAYRKGTLFPAPGVHGDPVKFAQLRRDTYAALRAKYTIDQRRCHWTVPAIEDNPLAGPGLLSTNAVYNLHDPCFREFVGRALLHPFSFGFAEDLFAYRGNPFHPDVTRAAYGKFLASAVFVDVDHQPWDKAVVLKEYPKAYIVTRAASDEALPAVVHPGEFCKRARREGTSDCTLPNVVVGGPLKSLDDMTKHSLGQLVELNCKHGVALHFYVGSLSGAERVCQATGPLCAPVVIRGEDKSKGKAKKNDRVASNRILRIARLRENQRTMIRAFWSEKGSPFPTVVLMDFDLGSVPSSSELMAVVRKTMADEAAPDVTCALGVWHHEYQESFYDTFAAVHLDGTLVQRRADQLRGTEPAPAGWNPAHTVTRSPIGHYTMWDLTQEVLQEAPKHGGYFPMKSCFNGLAIYKAHAFFDPECHYEHSDYDMAGELSHYANNYDTQPCEHVVFNLCLASHGAKIGVSPALRTAWHVGGQPAPKSSLVVPNPHYSGHLNDDFPITSTNTIASFVPHGFTLDKRRVEEISTLENERFVLRINAEGRLVLEDKATHTVQWTPPANESTAQKNWYRTVLALGDHGELLLFQQVEEAEARNTDACVAFDESEFAETKTCRILLWRTNGVNDNKGARFSLTLEEDGVLTVSRSKKDRRKKEKRTIWSSTAGADTSMTQCIKGSGALFSLPQSC